MEKKIADKIYGDQSILEERRSRAIWLRRNGKENFYYDDGCDHNFLMEFENVDVGAENCIAVERLKSGLDFFDRASIYERDLVIECSGEMELFDYDVKNHMIISTSTQKSVHVRCSSEGDVIGFLLPKEILLLHPETELVLNGMMPYVIKNNVLS